MTKYDWGTEEEETPEQVARALQRVANESRKRRIRRRSAVGALAAVLVVAGFVGGTQLDHNSPEKDSVQLVVQNEAPGPSDTVASAPGIAPSTASPKNAAASRPNVAYVAKNTNDGKGRIVVIDGRSGKEIKTLVSGSTMNDLTLTPDGSQLFYTEQDESKIPSDLAMFDHAPSLKLISTNGGSSSFYAYNAHTPRVSPDGERIAFVEHGLSDVSGRVVVIDVASRDRRYIDALDLSSKITRETGWIRGVIGWTDNSHLAAIGSVFPAPADGSTVAVPAKHYYHLFDVNAVADDSEIYKASNSDNLFAFPKATESTFYDGVLVGGDKVFVVENNGIDSAARMLLIDAHTGTVTKVVAAGYVGRAYGNPATDRSGDHLIYMSANDVRVSDFGGNPVVLATGVTSAAW